MDEKKKLNHWYHGVIYEKFITPAQMPVYDGIIDMIDEGASVLDIGCGTGGMTLPASIKAGKVTGIDLSPANITQAEKQLSRNGFNNVNFIQGSATELTKIVNYNYDYAVVSFIIHELDPPVRDQVIEQIKAVSGKLIIAEYRQPQPKSIFGAAMYIAEFFAGVEHFKNFRNFMAAGGAPAFLKKHGYKIEEEKLLRKRTTVIYKGTKD